MYRCGGSNNTMMFSMPYDGESPISSAVDCTLSLGTPATRLTGDHYDRVNDRRSSANWSANFCWDILHSSSSQKTNRGGANVVEPIPARRCANCDTTSTPLWRNGPRGPKSLCNACGIRFKKEERRANAAATADGNDTTETQHYQPMMNNHPWVHHHTQAAAHKLPSCYLPAAAKVNEFRFIDDVDDRDSPYLSWRLNVTDGPGLVHGFTR
ncbi:GATA transcription factor 19-like [Bidens hawaiensis]|uniref:GATA transcription factor 19-like n=1 Tax=Bidens hawaiensis TaxID=980011 RepID=UPI00404A509C